MSEENSFPKIGLKKFLEDFFGHENQGTKIFLSQIRWEKFLKTETKWKTKTCKTFSKKQEKKGKYILSER